MPFYFEAGTIPHKRHTVFKSPSGKLYQEELVGTQGFAGMSSLVYHLYPPTLVKETLKPFSVQPEIAIEKNLKSLSFTGFDLPPADDYLDSRQVLFVNNEMHIGLAAPRKSMTDYFFKNADADELIFVHRGSGVLKTLYGEVEFSQDDYLLIPRGVTYQIQFNGSDNRLLYIEAFSPVTLPSRYRNNIGQMLEHSPFCERDIRKPKNLVTHDEKGEFRIMIKKQNMIYPFIYSTHPFDAVGWDGYFYPYAFSIHDFEPITGRIHMPPPVHQTFENAGFVVCSFVPRLYDYHPDAIPVPYHHSNIDSEEILYYVDGDFMSRNNIQKEQLTLHPGGIPHGPHPGAIERSIGQKETRELAVMIDPFRPVQITKAAMALEVKDYQRSWISEPVIS